jgi:hypothetical protein
MKTFNIKLQITTEDNGEQVREKLLNLFARVEIGGIREIDVRDEGTENYEHVHVIEAEWPISTQWHMDEVLDYINSVERETPYTAEDIDSTWVKWNTLHVQTRDGDEWKIEGYYDQEIDFKTPLKTYHWDKDWNRLYEE